MATSHHKLIRGPDGEPRCRWCGAAPDFLPYHDEEWGMPVADDSRLFEKLCLEAFQSGLSWRTVLAKRENLRAAFHGFNIDRVAAFGANDVERLLADAGIIRHRGKIEAIVNNAWHAQEIAARHGTLAAFLWAHEPDPASNPAPQTASTSPASVALSKRLKGLGWRFVGPTTVFAFMQAVGMINDHVEGCIRRDAVTRARAGFTRPGT